MKPIILTTLPILLLLTGCQETTYQTGIPGVVVKNVECVDAVPQQQTREGIAFSLVNRSSSNLNFKHRLSVIVLDRDGDPVGRGSTIVRIRANSGRKFTIDCDCQHASSYKFTLTPWK